MEILERVKDKITETSQNVVQMTKDTTEIMKLNNAIKAHEKEIEGQFFKIGIKYYAENKDSYPEAYKEFFGKIDLLQSKINESRVQIGALSTEIVCENCGKQIEEGTKFCIYCGAPALNEKPQTTIENKRCMSCGKEIEVDAAFCTYCGVAVINEKNDASIVEQEQVNEILEPTCQKCGAILEKDAMFCTECGTKCE